MLWVSLPAKRAYLRKNLKNTSVVAILYTKDAGSGAVKEVLQVEKLVLMK